MIQIYSDVSSEILRLDKNEEVIKALTEHIKSSNIPSAIFTAVGAASSVLLSFYNLSKKEYETKAFHEEVEITSVTGNISRIEETIKIHAHGTFSKKDFSVIGGHIQEIVISATGEIHLTKLPKQLVRKYDEETGLYLLSD